MRQNLARQRAEKAGRGVAEFGPLLQKITTALPREKRHEDSDRGQDCDGDPQRRLALPEHQSATERQSDQARPKIAGDCGPKGLRAVHRVPSRHAS
jgi:hypothetical protein